MWALALPQDEVLVAEQAATLRSRGIAARADRNPASVAAAAWVPAAQRDRAALAWPHGVAEVVPGTLPLVRFADVLRCLLAEGVGIRNLRRILTAVALVGRLTDDPVLLAESARGALNRQLTHQHGRGTGEPAVCCCTRTSRRCWPPACATAPPRAGWRWTRPTAAVCSPACTNPQLRWGLDGQAGWAPGTPVPDT